jgi:hypothetical protein
LWETNFLLIFCYIFVQDAHLVPNQWPWTIFGGFKCNPFFRFEAFFNFLNANFLNWDKISWLSGETHNSTWLVQNFSPENLSKKYFPRNWAEKNFNPEIDKNQGLKTKGQFSSLFYIFWQCVL